MEMATDSHISESADCTTSSNFNFSIWDELKYLANVKEIVVINQISQFDSIQANNCKEVIQGDEKLPQIDNEPIVSKKYSCSVCKQNFNNYNNQAIHFKSDLHCINLKRQLSGKEPLDYEDNESDVDESDKSTSESESESKMDLIDVFNRHPKIIFENKLGDQFSIYKCLIFARREIPSSNENIISRMDELPKSIFWAVILLSAGHFAAALFERNNVLEHKTFHRYVTRKKQGSSQSSYDRLGHHAKSAGANLRRYNEMALNDEVTSLLHSWQPKLSKCNHIFYRACGSSRSILFSGKKSIFKKDDTRLRRIPFSTKRPTHGEVIRTHSKLSTIERLRELFLPTATRNSPLKKQGFQSNKNVNSTANISEIKLDSQNIRKKEQKKEKPKRQENPSPVVSVNDSGSSDEDTHLEFEEELSFTSELKSFDISNFKKRTKTSPTLKGEEKFFDDLYTSCKVNDVENAKKLILTKQNKNQFLNKLIGRQAGTTLLHIASANGYKEMVELLLEEGADPTLKDGNGKLPYCAARNKQTRNIFSTFVAKYPNRYNYNEGQIPVPLTEEEEKLKQFIKQKQRQEKRLHAKEKKIMLEEKSNFLKLGQSEKIQWNQQHGKKMRCFNCGELILDIPFEYSNVKCCSMKCILEHRKTMK